MRIAMLTTIDNPYDPFDQWDEWYNFDTNVKGYNSCSYLARIANTSSDQSELDQNLEIEEAIDEIVKLNVLGIYRKVVRDVEDVFVESENSQN